MFSGFTTDVTPKKGGKNCSSDNHLHTDLIIYKGLPNNETEVELNVVVIFNNGTMDEQIRNEFRKLVDELGVENIEWLSPSDMVKDAEYIYAAVSYKIYDGKFVLHFTKPLKEADIEGSIRNISHTIISQDHYCQLEDIFIANYDIMQNNTCHHKNKFHPYFHIAFEAEDGYQIHYDSRFTKDLSGIVWTYGKGVFKESGFVEKIAMMYCKKYWCYDLEKPYYTHINDTLILHYRDGTIHTVLGVHEFHVFPGFTNETDVVCFDLDEHILQYIIVDEWVMYYSLIGVILSCLGLFYAFLSYCLFANLRTTLQGKSMICVILSMLIAYIVSSCSHFPIPQSGVCLFVAALQQFMWIASFTWVNVLLFDFCRSLIITGHSNKGTCFVFSMYFIYGFGIPVIVVVAAIVSTKVLNTGWVYLQHNICWLQRDILLYFFVVPMGILLIFNFILFVAAVIKLYKTFAAHKRTGVEKSLRYKIIMYTKLFILMGFTWSFGFLSTIPNLSVLNYAFIICVPLQGFFLALAFGCSTKVRQNWVHKLSCCRNQSDSDHERSVSVTAMNNNVSMTDIMNHSDDI